MKLGTQAISSIYLYWRLILISGNEAGSFYGFYSGQIKELPACVLSLATPFTSDALWLDVCGATCFASVGTASCYFILASNTSMLVSTEIWSVRAPLNKFSNLFLLLFVDHLFLSKVNCECFCNVWTFTHSWFGSGAWSCCCHFR